MSHRGTATWRMSVLALGFLLVIVSIGSSLAATVETNQGTYSVATTYNEEKSNWFYGWALCGRTAGGSYGAYSVLSYVYVDPVESWYNAMTGEENATSDGWIEKELILGEGELGCKVSVTYHVAGVVSFGGTMDCDNGFPTILGNAEFYAFANVVLTGMADRNATVRGLFAAEEQAAEVGITMGPLHVTVPTWEDDQATLAGDDVVSAGDTILAGNHAFIRWQGTVKSYAHSFDGGERSDGTPRTIRNEFSLTIN